MKKVLSVAGSDCSGGAGIQADIKTISAHKMYAMSAITALTAQNTTGVTGIMNSEPEFVGKQMDAVFTDIYPDAVKVGMVSTSNIIEAIVDKLKQYKAPNIVVDPIMVATSGRRLLSEDAKDALISLLIPCSQLITPNIPEAQILSGLTITDQKDMVKAAQQIAKNYQGGILIKGGHMLADAVDLLYENDTVHWFYAPRITNPNTHGTGCTLSAAITCNLADGCSLEDSITNAKSYLSGALNQMLDLGSGPGPVDHLYNLSKSDELTWI